MLAERLSVRLSAEDRHAFDQIARALGERRKSPLLDRSTVIRTALIAAAALAQRGELPALLDAL